MLRLFFKSKEEKELKNFIEEERLKRFEECRQNEESLKESVVNINEVCNQLSIRVSDLETLSDRLKDGAGASTRYLEVDEIHNGCQKIVDEVETRCNNYRS